MTRTSLAALEALPGFDLLVMPGLATHALLMRLGSRGQQLR